MRKLLGEFNGLVWTLASTGLVLITLSGATRTWGIRISVAALLLNLAGILATARDDD